MNIIKGNLLDKAENLEFDAIIHGCNCFHAMGSGIAGQIAARYPQVPRKDKQETVYGDRSKLGSYQRVIVNTKYKELPKFAGVRSKRELIKIPPFMIINAYTQFRLGADFMPGIFPVLLKQLNEDFEGQHIAFPRIGCGIGSGDWMQVEDMLLKYLTDTKVTVVVYG